MVKGNIALWKTRGVASAICGMWVNWYTSHMEEIGKETGKPDGNRRQIGILRVAVNRIFSFDLGIFRPGRGRNPHQPSPDICMISESHYFRVR